MKGEEGRKREQSQQIGGTDIGEVARRAGGSVINSRLKQRATPEDSPLIHTVVLQARTSLPRDMKHTHTHTHTHKQHKHILTKYMIETGHTALWVSLSFSGFHRLSACKGWKKTKSPRRPQTKFPLPADKTPPAPERLISLSVNMCKLSTSLIIMSHICIMHNQPMGAEEGEILETY